MVEIKPLHILTVLVIGFIILVAILFSFQSPAKAEVDPDSLTYNFEKNMDNTKLALEFDSAKKALKATEVLDKRIGNLENSISRLPPDQNSNSNSENLEDTYKFLEDYLNTLNEFQKSINDVQSRKNTNDLFAIDSVLKKIIEYESKIASLQNQIREVESKNQKNLEKETQTTAGTSPPSSGSNSTVINQNTVINNIQNNITSSDNNLTLSILQKLEDAKKQNEEIQSKAEQAKKYNLDLLRKEIADTRENLFSLKQSINCLNNLAANAEAKLAKIDSMLAQNNPDGALTDMLEIKNINLQKNAC
ncbi:MAG: hypothetical protein AABX38_08085 [Candidatus Micrarchaeota archaeon]